MNALFCDVASAAARAAIATIGRSAAARLPLTVVMPFVLMLAAPSASTAQPGATPRFVIVDGKRYPVGALPTPVPTISVPACARVDGLASISTDQFEPRVTRAVTRAVALADPVGPRPLPARPLLEGAMT